MHLREVRDDACASMRIAAFRSRERAEDVNGARSISEP
jgi:hypothetical protein